MDKKEICDKEKLDKILGEKYKHSRTYQYELENRKARDNLRKDTPQYKRRERMKMVIFAVVLILFILCIPYMAELLS